MADIIITKKIMKKIALFIILLIALSSCKTKYVTVESIRDVYHTTTDTIRDSIKHAVLVKQYIRGDTIYNDRVEYLYKDRWRIHDSVIIQRDSIPYPVEVVKEVQEPTPLWHYLVVGGAILVLLFTFFKRFTT